jgi:hypothetical protein
MGAKAKGKRQKAKGKRQKAKGKRQKAKGKRQKAEGRRQRKRRTASLGRCINCHLLVRSAWQILNS